MDIRYQQLFELKIQHAYYANEQTQGVKLYPTPSCQKVIAQHNLIFKTSHASFSLYAQIDTGSVALFHEFVTDVRKLSFYMELQESTLLNVSDLPSYKIGQELFYFDNLSDQRNVPIDESSLFLGNALENQQWGASVAWVKSSIYEYYFDSPVSSAELKIKNANDDRLIYVQTINGNDARESYRLDLAELKLNPGLYVIEESDENRKVIYFYPELRSKPVFAVFDLFIDTKINEYRYLLSNNSLVLSTPRYVVKFAALKTVWRYFIIKAYNNNGVALNELSVVAENDETVFSSNNNDGKQIVFTATSSLPLMYKQSVAIQLQRMLNGSASKYLDLPAPTISTALQLNHPGGFYSDIYVYV